MRYCHQLPESALCLRDVQTAMLKSVRTDGKTSDISFVTQLTLVQMNAKEWAFTGFSAGRSLLIPKFSSLLSFSTCYWEDIGIPERAEEKLTADSWRSGWRYDSSKHWLLIFAWIRLQLPTFEMVLLRICTLILWILLRSLLHCWLVSSVCVFS